MRRPTALLLGLLLLLLASVTVEGEVATFDGVLRVEWHPDGLSLWPGGEGTVRVTLENLDNQTLHVALVFRAIETLGGSRAEVTPHYLELAPGEVQRVKVVVRAHPTFVQDPGTSDCSIDVYWGRNLTRYGDEPGQVNDSTADGRDRIVIPVRDVPPYGWASVVGLVVLVAIIAAVAYIVWRRRGPRPSKESGPEERPMDLDLGPFR